MAHRFTIKEVEEWSDERIIYMIIGDRYNQSVTNPYSPFGKRLEAIMKKYRDMVLKQGGFV